MPERQPQTCNTEPDDIANARNSTHSGFWFNYRAAKWPQRIIGHAETCYSKWNGHNEQARYNTCAHIDERQPNACKEKPNEIQDEFHTPQDSWIKSPIVVGNYHTTKSRAQLPPHHQKNPYPQENSAE